MNSRDPLFLNYMALWLCICKEVSIAHAISVMDIPYDRTRKMEAQNEHKRDYSKIAKHIRLLQK